MKRNLPLDLDANLDLFDDFGDFTTTETEKTQKEKVTPIHSDNWTIVEALNTINELLPGCQLKNDFFIRCAEAFDFLTQKLQFNPVQCVIIAMLIEKGKPISYRQTVIQNDAGKELPIVNFEMKLKHEARSDIYDYFAK